MPDEPIVAFPDVDADRLLTALCATVTGDGPRAARLRTSASQCVVDEPSDLDAARWFQSLVELAYLPHPADLAAKLDVVTTDFVYARLIGDRKATEAASKTFDRVVVDQSPSLQRWGLLLRALMARVPEVYAFANNHFAGHGPATARELLARTMA